MPKPKYTLVEMQTASAGLITGLDKATQRVSNLEGIVKRYYKLRKEIQTQREHKNSGTLQKVQHVCCGTLDRHCLKQ